jgi:hypothetical protein
MPVKRQIIAVLATAALAVVGVFIEPGIVNAATPVAATKVSEVKAATCNGALSKYQVLQSATSDGTSIYIVFAVASSDSKSNKTGGTVLTKWTSDAKRCIGWNNKLNLGHANSVTYHPNYSGTGAALLVPRGTKSKKNTGIVVVDANTLNQRSVIQLTNRSAKNKTKKAPALNMSGLCYSSGKYAARIGGKMYVYNESAALKPNSFFTRSFKVATVAGTGEQGIDCDAANIYGGRAISGTKGKTNYIHVYSWSGKRGRTLTFPGKATLRGANKGKAVELESVFHIGSQFYLATNSNFSGKFKDAIYTIRW